MPMTQRQPDPIDQAAAAMDAMASAAGVGGARQKGDIGGVIDHFRRVGKLGGDEGDRLGPRRPYEQIEAVYRCVNFAANSVACMPLMIGTDRDEIIESGPIADLLDQPNTQQSMADVVQETIGWLLLSGRAYWLFGEMRSGRPTAIQAVGAGQVRPHYAGQTHPNAAPPRGMELVGWWFRESGRTWSEAEPLQLEEVWSIALPNYNPDRPHDGLAVTDIVRRKINQVWKADSANELSLDNNMQFASAISPDEPVTEEQWDAFVAQMREQYEGHRQRNRPLLSNRKLNVESVSNTFDEMEFSELLDRSVASICVGFGFDPAAVGYPPRGGRFEYVRQAKQSAWIDTILPLASLVASHFDRGVLARFEADRSITNRSELRDARRRLVTRSEAAAYGRRRAIKRRAERRQSGRLIAWFDDSDVPAVREARLQLAKEGATFVDTYKAPPADVIELFDIGLPIHEWQRSGWQQLNELPIDQAADELEQPDEPDPGEPEPGEDEPGDNAQPPDHVKRLTIEQLDRIQDTWFRSWQPLRRQLERKISGHFGRLRKEVLENLRRLDPQSRSARTRKDLVTQILFNVAAAKVDMLRVTEPVIRETFRFGGEQIARQNADAEGDDETAVNSPIDVNSPDVSRAIRQRLNFLRGVDDTVFAELQSTLGRMSDEGASIADIGAAVRDRFGIASRRARNIAQTEIGAAIEKANHLAREQTGVESKSWLSSRKAEARRSHLIVERSTLREPIAIDDRFEIPPSANSPGGTALHPRDTSLPAGEVVNCGCTVISRFPGDNVRDARHLAALATKGWLIHGARQVNQTPTEDQDHDTQR